MAHGRDVRRGGRFYWDEQNMGFIAAKHSRSLVLIAVEGNQEHNTLRIRGHETIFGGENRAAVGIVD
jgi:hypothetical protein